MHMSLHHVYNDRTMPNVELVRAFFIYYNMFRFQVDFTIIFLVIVFIDTQTDTQLDRQAEQTDTQRQT